MRSAASILGLAGLAFTATAARADDMMATHRLSAMMASEAASAAVEACAKQGYAETAVVVDADGLRQAVLRGDRAGAHTLDSAFYKAFTAASFKADTTALVERAKTSPTLTSLVVKLPNLVLAGGGLVIKMGGEVVGAIGASGAPGAELDDGCAKAGVDRIRDRLK